MTVGMHAQRRFPRNSPAVRTKIITSLSLVIMLFLGLAAGHSAAVLPEPVGAGTAAIVAVPDVIGGHAGLEESDAGSEQLLLTASALCLLCVLAGLVSFFLMRAWWRRPHPPVYRPAPRPVASSAPFMSLRATGPTLISLGLSRT